MDLLPTGEELNRLWREISPRHRFLQAVRQAVNEACRLDGDSMATFFLDSQDIYLIQEEGAMPYHIEPPAYLEHNRDNCPVDFKGWTIMPRGLRANAGLYEDYSGIDLGEKVSWEEI